MNTSRINNRWPIAKEGFPFVLIAWGLFSLSLFLHLLPLTLFFFLSALFVTYFFRDPERRRPIPEKAMLTPADGKVLEVTRVEPGERNLLDEPAERVSIFMSVFNVHVNRIPVDGTIKRITYSPGKFFSADLDKASKYNENNRLLVETPDGREIGLIQIAGLIARRIACWVSVGDHVKAGQRFGLIRFGSRVEVYLPAGSRVTVRPGQKVRAGETVIGYLP